ncbi:MAG: cytochrome P450 [Halieaceae bacterium]
MTDSSKSENIDLYNPDNYVDALPTAAMDRLRSECPVFRHPHPDGGDYWLLTRHADVVAVSRDHRTFSSERGFVMVDDLPDDILEQVRSQLLGMDPPRHGPIRRLVISRFTKSMLAQMEPRVRELCRDIFARPEARGDCDFVDDVAGRLPTAVIGEMMGVPPDMWEQMRIWSDMQTSGDDPDLGASAEEIQQASIEMGSYGYQLACERREQGGDDLTSLLVNVEVDGEKISEIEFASLFVQITVAGNETTRGLIAGGMQQLIEQPELYRELEQNPQAIPAAVEEMLRFCCPLHYFRRTATADTAIGEQPVAENDRVVMMYSAANRDPEVFRDPHRFDITRQDNPHLAFGYGIHLCLGANLARLEARVFFEEFFRAYAGIESLGPVRRIRSNMVNGPKAMPVRLQRR